MTVQELLNYNIEMAEHASGVTQFLTSLIGGQYVTKEQTCETIDFLFALTKRNIENYPNATKQEKDAVIRKKEFLKNMLKHQMGL